MGLCWGRSFLPIANITSHPYLSGDFFPLCPSTSGVEPSLTGLWCTLFGGAWLLHHLLPAEHLSSLDLGVQPSVLLVLVLSFPAAQWNALGFPRKNATHPALLFQRWMPPGCQELSALSSYILTIIQAVQALITVSLSPKEASLILLRAWFLWRKLDQLVNQTEYGYNLPGSAGLCDCQVDSWLPVNSR